MLCYRALRSTLVSVALVFAVTGCSVLAPDQHMAAFSTQLTGLNQAPPVVTAATGKLYAVLDKNTLLFRWKLAFSGLSGPATAGHFHGPGAIGANAKSAIAINSPIKSPSEGRATLTAAQTEDLLAGKWYVNIRTKAHPGGEIRGQLILRE